MLSLTAAQYVFEAMNLTPQHIDRIWINANLATLAAAGTARYGGLKDHAIASSAGRISWIAPMAEVEAALSGAGFDAEIIDAAGGWITPGLVDSHTHLVFGGDRSREFELRRQGLSYQAIARQGGGIRATVAATRAMSEQQLIDAALPRLRALCAEGVTTVEIKSGYGLNLDDELKMLRAARALSEYLPVNIRTSLLAAHSVPPEFDGDADGYVTLVCSELIPRAAELKLADYVDAFCEGIGFSLAQCERVFSAARAHGLGIKAHVEQLCHLGGATLAARYGALSVDHLEYLEDSDIEALRHSGTVACLLPGAYYFLNQQRLPPVEKLRRAAIPMALGSDLNPGSSPLASLRLMMNMAAVLFGLSCEEALQGVTREGAKALGLGHCKGQLRCGYDADLLLWDIDDPAQLSYEFGPQRLRQRVLAGEDQSLVEHTGAAGQYRAPGD